jgi:hypothetical protein
MAKPIEDTQGSIVTQSRIVVLGATPTDTQALVAQWQPVLRAELVGIASPKELLREIERRQVDCVIADYHALTEQGDPAQRRAHGARRGARR